MAATAPLQMEQETYERLRDRLLAESEGKFVLIHEDEVAGAWDTYEDALQAGYQKYGLQQFMVKQLQGVEAVLSFSRDVFPCRS
jgi:hypothetical protein